MAEHKTLTIYGGEVKALGDGKVGGYLVRFSTARDPDLEGDYFTPDTDFGVHDTTPTLYQHGLDVTLGRRVLGTGKMRRDEVGVWVEAQLALRDEYERAVYELAEQGKLGWSSGTAAHLVQRKRVGKANEITAWHLGLDASLTPTPAEPRNAAMTIKALPVPVETEAEAEGGQEAAADADVTAGTDANKPNNESADAQEVTTMDNEKTVAELVAAEFAKREAEAKAAQELQNKLEAAKAEGRKEAEESYKTLGRRGGYAFHKLAKAGGDNDGMDTFRHFVRTGDRIAAKAALQEDTDSEGGYLVPDGFYNRIAEKLQERAVVRAAGATVIQTNLKMVEFPKENAESDSTTTAEEAAYTQSEPTFDVEQITVYKAAGYMKISEELLADQQANLDQFLTNQIVNGIAEWENTNFITGSGSSAPKGIVTAGSSGKTAASASTITAAEMVDLIHSLGDRYAANAALFMRRATLGLLRGLTGNPFYFQPTPQGINGRADAGVGTEGLFNLPVYQTVGVAAIAASAKAVVICDPSQYIILENGGLTVDRNPYLYQANGQVGIFWKKREGGSLPIGEACKFLTMAS